jgi:protein transport protein SEC61 subunit alpha
MAGIGIGTVINFLLDLYGLLDSDEDKRNDSELEETARMSISPERAATKFPVIPVLSTLWLATMYTIKAPSFQFLPGRFVPVLVLLQLFGTGVLLLYFNEILTKYGLFSSGLTPVLIVAHRAKAIFWDAFSPIALDVGRGSEFQGAILNTVHLLWTWADRNLAIYEAVFRKNQPSLSLLCLSALVFFFLFFLKGLHHSEIAEIGVRVEIPLRSTVKVGERGTIPIPLFVTSMEPLIWNYGSIGCLFSFTLLRHMYVPTTWKIFLIFGTWAEGGSLGYTPTGGLIYWLLPPAYFPECEDGLRIWVYGIYIITSCVLISRCTIERDHDFNPDKMAEDLLGPTGVTLAGVDKERAADELRRELHKIIPITTVLGGLILGSVCVSSDVLHLLGGGHSLLGLEVLISSVFEMRKKEKDIKEKEV